MLDVGLDRFTFSIQMFFLSSVYTKHWACFLCVQFIKVHGDLIRLVSSNYADNVLRMSKLQDNYSMQDIAKNEPEKESTLVSFFMYPLIW